jgi:adenylate cyclase
MPDLIAQGPQNSHRWRRKLQPGVRQVLGRQAGAWSTPWDERISRRHVEIEYLDGKLRVSSLPGATNPVFFRGQKSDDFLLRAGEHFVIGQTAFTLVEERVHVSLDLPRPDGERTFTLEELRRQPFRHADKRLDVLSRLPDIISGSASDQELFVRLVNLLLTGIEPASAAAVVAVRGSEGSGFGVQGSGEEPGARGQAPAGAAANPQSAIHNPQSPIPNPQSDIVEVLHWDRRVLAGSEFRPSERLIRQAIETDQSVAHVWNAAQAKEGEFTVSEGVDWALCTPVPGRACAGWALYVTGGFHAELAPQEASAESLRDEVKFAELTATTLSALREARLLAARQAGLAQFFSPVVLDAVASQEAEEALAPREADVVVLFCDLRGFTRQSERAAGDLFGLLNRVSQALGVMTRHILEQGGVVGDFHGDAAMGFWGWPLAQPDAVERACRAALGIRAAFVASSRREEAAPAEGAIRQPASSELPAPDGVRSLQDFRVGIGIASGRAVAGKIGTVDQVKVTVFGPVVNLAARLESMTRQLQASILIDPPTAAVIRATLPPSVCRVRRLAKVLPVGLSAPLEVSELLPPLSLEKGPGEGVLSDAALAAYEAALDAFQARDWQLALKHLHAVPPDDQAKDFLTVYIAQHGRTPPPNWDGTIPLEGK